MLSLIATLAALALASTTAQASFQLGLQDPRLLAADPGVGYRALKAINGSVVRINVYWPAVAPKPGVGSDPANPLYRWTGTDAAVRTAARHHKRILLDVYGAPAWTEGPNKPAPTVVREGTWAPNAALFGQFMHAIAARYDGAFADPLNPGTNLPRIKDYEIWNEENLPLYLTAPNREAEYRALFVAGYAGVKAVDRGDRVAIGGLAPISYVGGPLGSASPLTMAADLMCLRRVGTHFVKVRGCRAVRFDALAIHPYTLAATPTKHAYHYDDLLVGDMQKLRTLLNSARHLHTIQGKPQLWVTEWAWLTNPPNAGLGDNATTAARYVAYAMYEMWNTGTSMVVWQTIQDFATAEPSGGGLETEAGQPKPDMRAFGFPFIASVQGKRGYAWGRVPLPGRRKVFVQHHTRRGWTTVETVRTSGDGTFQARFPAKGNGNYRARVQHGPTSLSYFSAKIPGQRTRQTVNPG